MDIGNIPFLGTTTYLDSASEFGVAAIAASMKKCFELVLRYLNLLSYYVYTPD